MNIPLEGLDHVRDFLRLDFLFSGLEVSSTMVFVARVLVLLVLGGALIWGSLRIVLKVLDCVQAFMVNLNRLPRVFFVLLLIVAPLWPESLGAQWAGHILLMLFLMCCLCLVTLILVLWKYGVEKTLRLLDYFKLRRAEERDAAGRTPEATLGSTPL